MKKIVPAVLLSLALLPFAACAAPSRAAGTTVQDIIDWLTTTWEQVSQEASEQLKHRSTATPTHARLGDEVAATENLAVSVVSVEAGPLCLIASQLRV